MQHQNAVTLFDTENLLGGHAVTTRTVQGLRHVLAATVGRDMGKFIASTGHSTTLMTLASAWGDAFYTYGKGKDGADLALIAAWQKHYEGAVVGTLYIASGDHIFAETARRASAQGTRVVVVYRRGSLSRELAHVADELIELPDPREWKLELGA